MNSRLSAPYRAIFILFSFLLVLTGVVWRGANASPQSAVASGDGQRIACVDRLKVVQTANLHFLAERKRKVLDAMNESSAGVEAKMKVIGQLQDKLAKGKSTLKQTELVNLSVEIQALDKEIREEQQRIQREFDIGFAENLKLAYARVQKSVEAIGKSRGFDLIIDRSPEIILYCKPTVDISDLVIAHLNATDAPAPPAKPAP